MAGASGAGSYFKSGVRSREPRFNESCVRVAAMLFAVVGALFCVFARMAGGLGLLAVCIVINSNELISIHIEPFKSLTPCYT